MHVYYKFGLLLIFILSISTCLTRATPVPNNQSTIDNYDDYDYYDNSETGENATSTHGNATLDASGTTEKSSSPLSFASLFNKLDELIPKPHTNHVLEPNCPRACFCYDDYTRIMCSHAGLTEVPRNLPSTALIIDLSNNRIKELRADDFANHPKLRELNLEGNELTALPKETFNKLKRLENLRLTNNRLTHIDPNTFSGARELVALDLSNNTIELRSDGTFLNQPDLVAFYCRNCSWTQLYDQTFENMTSLTALRLDQNDFNKKINTKAFRLLPNIVKLRLPELEKSEIQDLCNLLKSIDAISFKHFDISCFELVLGTSFNESLILVTDPPYKAPTFEDVPPEAEVSATTNQRNNKTAPKAPEKKPVKNMTDNNITNVLAAGIAGASTVNTSTNDSSVTQNVKSNDKETYQVSISQETINYILISIIVVAVIGIIIGIICRKDVCGIKTKCCRTRKPEPKDQVHPTEEIPLNKLAA